jgi:hypothetical protein
MSIILHQMGDRTFSLRGVVPEPVFVAEQPRTSSACDTPHTGPATLLAWMDPTLGGEPLGIVKLPSGRLLNIRASAIASAANLATIRLNPATRPAPASATRRPA